MLATYKKIGITIIVLLLGVGSALLWQSSKQTKQETLSATKKRTLQNKEYTPSPEYLQKLPEEMIQSIERNANTRAEYLQKLEEETTKREKKWDKRLVELRNFIDEQEKKMAEADTEREARIAHGNKAEQELEVIRYKMDSITPILDRMHAFFGTEPSVIPKPPDDATSAEIVAFYQDLKDKMEQDPHYLRSKPRQITERRSSQTLEENVIGTSQNDGGSLDTPHFPINVKSQITALRATLAEQYFDVLVSPHLTSEEFYQHFPTEKERENLQTRKSEMTQHVVKNMRPFLSDEDNNQKISIIRELLTKNFDKDFADAVLTELEKDTE